MSVSLWAYTESCVGKPCPGDCDLCRKAEEEEEKMAEYIDKAIAKERLANLFQLQATTAEAIIDAIPSADVAPVRRGKWLRTTCSPHRIFCSECYGTFIPDDEVTRLKDVPHRFCPKCGNENYMRHLVGKSESYGRDYDSKRVLEPRQTGGR